MIATQGYALATAVGGQPITRSGVGPRVGILQARFNWPAKDGMVSIAHLFGATAGPPTRRLMDYVCEQGFCDADTRDKNWIEYGAMLLDGREPISEFDRVKDCIAACTASKPKAELMAAALDRRLLIAPVNTVADLANSEQLAARGYLVKPDGDGPSAGVRYPGPFAKFSARRSAPPAPHPGSANTARRCWRSSSAWSQRLSAWRVKGAETRDSTRAGRWRVSRSSTSAG